MEEKPSSAADEATFAERSSRAEAYGKPRQVWVEDGHVFVEGHDGVVVRMTPEVAIELGRLIGNAGADSLVNKVLDEGGN
jgi:hypothetical protein